MTPYIEKRGAGFHMVSEAPGFRSREKILLKEGIDYQTGQILGRETATGEYAPVNLASETGLQTVAGVLWDGVNLTEATDPVEAAAHVRDCEVNGNEIIFPTGATSGNKLTIVAGLLPLGIVVRY